MIVLAARVSRALLWGLALLAMTACREIPPLPKIAAVPSFQLTDQRGAQISPQTLRGKVWIANFMFTSCPDVCPILTSKLGALRTELRPERASLAFVSISVDPEVDTPEVLAKYAKEHHADYDGWYFLTGPFDDVKAVVVAGFKQAMEKLPPPKPGEPYNVMHGSHFVLVDQNLQIRGYYGTDDPGRVTLTRDVRRLLAGKADE